VPVGNAEYILTAWYRAEGPAGDARLSISWHSKKTLSSTHRGTLREKMDYALRFKALHGVPVYVGEFTAHANPSPESVRNYLEDLISLMEGEGLHWSFWEYYSEYRGVGIHNGREKSLVNPPAWETLRKHMRKKG
jgi:hypothetical protein